jgi:hypothetical protein
MREVAGSTPGLDFIVYLHILDNFHIICGAICCCHALKRFKYNDTAVLYRVFVTTREKNMAIRSTCICNRHWHIWVKMY